MRAELFIGLLGVALVAAFPAACGSSSENASGSGAASGNGSGNTSGNGSGTGSGAGAGSSSSTGSGCPDRDGDGHKDAACGGDDCDDNDPLTFPGALEVCGDNKPNDCSAGSSDPPSCTVGGGGIGTFVSASTGSDTNPGTQASPVQTIAKGIQNAQAILAQTPGFGPIAVYVQEGNYTGPVTMVAGVSLIGGFDASWAVDCKKNDTAILCNAPGGAPVTSCVSIPDTATRTDLFEGFRVEGFSGAPTQHPGSVAVSVNGGSPTVHCNRIHGGGTTGGAAFDTKASIGLRLAGPVAGLGALIDDNEIAGGPSVDGGGNPVDASIGVFFEWQGGSNGALAEIVNNAISSGPGRNSAGIDTWAAVAGNVIHNNTIQSGPATNGTSWGIVASTQNGTCPGGVCTSTLVLVDKNVINADQTKSTCTTPSDWCGGIQSESAAVSITNNVIFGAAAPQSAGVQLAEREGSVQMVILNSNLLDGAGQVAAGSISAALVFEEYQNAAGGKHAITGNVRNNIFRGGSGTSQYGIYEATNPNNPLNTAHPNFLDHNDFDLKPDPTGVGPEWFYRRWDGTTAVQEVLITCAAASTACVDSSAFPLGLAGANGPANNDFGGDPLLDATYHLKAGSPCKDTGSSTEAPTDDRDGDPRPNGSGYDVGPDEK